MAPATRPARKSPGIFLMRLLAHPARRTVDNGTNPPHSRELSMLVRIFYRTGTYLIHAAHCPRADSEASDFRVTEVGSAEHFASQRAVFLHLHSAAIHERQGEALRLADDGEAVRAEIIRDITDLWVFTQFQPCTARLPRELAPELVAEVTRTLT